MFIERLWLLNIMYIKEQLSLGNKGNEPKEFVLKSHFDEPLKRGNKMALIK